MRGAQALYIRKKDPDCAGRLAWRGQHCRAVPPIARQGHANRDPERGEGISQGNYYKWSKDFMEAGKKRLAGDAARAANSDEVKELRREAKDLKEVVAPFERQPDMANDRAGM